MKRLAPAVLCLAIPLLSAAAGASATAGELTLKGFYYSGYHDGAAPLRAVFTPTAEGEWEVAFYFRHGGRPLTYQGVAAGSLASGDLSGKVKSEGGRIFTFRCEHDGGKFRGEHFEIDRRGREHRTGTLTLEE